MAQETIKNFVRTYLDFSFSLFFTKSKKILKEYQTFFDEKIVKNPLTYRQRISVILDEKRNLIVAGAGTGKTTTILAKVLYLIESKKYSEDEILLLAFSKTAKEEMAERLEKKSLQKVKVSTIVQVKQQLFWQKFSILSSQKNTLKMKYFCWHFQRLLKKKWQKD